MKTKLNELAKVLIEAFLISAGFGVVVLFLAWLSR